MINTYTTPNAFPSTSAVWTRYIEADTKTFPVDQSLLFITLKTSSIPIVGFFKVATKTFHKVNIDGTVAELDLGDIYLYTPLVFPSYPVILYKNLSVGTYFKLKDNQVALDTIFIVSTVKDYANGFEAVVAQEDSKVLAKGYKLGSSIVIGGEAIITVIDNVTP